MLGSSTTVVAVVNGVRVALDRGTTVSELVSSQCPSDRGVAVALDREVVPRSRWGTVEVVDGSVVEVVTAAAGG